MSCITGGRFRGAERHRTLLDWQAPSTVMVAASTPSATGISQGYRTTFPPRFRVQICRGDSEQTTRIVGRWWLSQTHRGNCPYLATMERAGLVEEQYGRCNSDDGRLGAQYRTEILCRPEGRRRCLASEVVLFHRKS